MIKLANSINAFGFDLWSKLSTKGNLVLSPYSVGTALAMTYGGAKARTADQMASVLHLLDATPENTLPEFGQLNNEIRLASMTPAIQLRSVNQLFADRRYTFNNDYLSSIDEAFLSTVELMDFRQPEECRLGINKQVAKHTGNRIVDLLPPSTITTDTRLVLVNAVYFLANWLRKFEEKHTKYESFKLESGDTTGVRMMKHESTKHLYGETDDVQLVELPYDGNDFSMLIVLPRQENGLSDIERSIDINKLTTWRRAISTRTINLHLPKYELSPDTMDLAVPLKTLGMTDAFSGAADFTGIATDRFWIGSAVSKSFIRVNESGTEAAAATAVTMARSIAPEIPEFRADHPFLFFIQENSTGLILFMGRVSNP